MENKVEDWLVENKDNLQFAEPSNIEELYVKFTELNSRNSDTDDPYLIGISEGIEVVLTDLKKIVKL